MARSAWLPPSGAIRSNQHQSCGPDMSPGKQQDALYQKEINRKSSISVLDTGSGAPRGLVLVLFEGFYASTVTCVL
jgi:hypothetical protein